VSNGAPVGTVLIHGAGHGAWCWQPLLPHLDGPTVAVDLPGRAGRPGPAEPTFHDLADAVIQDVEAAHLGEVILVGHSLAGATLPLIASKLGPRTRHMIFIAAPVLMPGEDAYSVLPFPQQQILRAIARAEKRRQRPPRKIPGYFVRTRFCNDMNADETAFVLSNVTPDNVALTLERASVTIADVPDTPATYVRLLRDKVLKPSIQATLGARLGRHADVVKIDAGHDVMISRPVELAGLINDVAGRYR
jgi:pimeloyl-ACP methyl ester carboxylesterase